MVEGTRPTPPDTSSFQDRQDTSARPTAENGVAIFQAVYAPPAIMLSGYEDGVGYLKVTADHVRRAGAPSDLDGFTRSGSAKGTGLLTPTDAHAEGHFKIKKLFQGHKNLRGAATTLMLTGTGSESSKDLKNIEASILGFDRVSFTGIVFPGQTIEYAAKATSGRRDITFGDVEGYVDGKPVIQVKNLVVTPDQKARTLVTFRSDQIVEGSALTIGTKTLEGREDLVSPDGMPTILPLFEGIGLAQFIEPVYIGDVLSFVPELSESAGKRDFAGGVRVKRQRDTVAEINELKGKILPFTIAKRMLGIT